MSDNNLDDLILTEPESESGSNRGLLVILGLVVLLLILGVVLANIIFGGTGDDNVTKEGVKPDSAKVIESDKKENLSLNTKASNNKGEALEKNDIDKDLAPLDEKDDLVNADIEQHNHKKQTESKEKIKATAAAATAGIAAATVVTKKHIERVVHKPKPVVRERRVEHKPKPVVHKPRPKPRREGIRYGGNIYIQVGSFSKGPTERFIDKIRRAGFKYRIKEVNGFRRVLIGPFRSSSDAQKYLGTVRSKVSSSAFIKR
jgi:DedD protein